MRRLVYDNDYQASDLTGKTWQRWRPDPDAWEAEEDGKAFRHGMRVGNGGEQGEWLRYRHLLRKDQGKPTLITDFMGYNSNESWEWKPQLNQWLPAPSRDTPGSPNGMNWVGDLILECEVKVEKAEGELVLELVRGPDRFRAHWDLASEDGVCTLTRQSVNGPDSSAEVLDRQPTRLRKGTYRLRFANVDRRLTVWVDNQLPFGAGVPYDPPAFVGPTEADLQPASIGVKGGALTVRKLKLWRDTYHAVAPNNLRVSPQKGADVEVGDWGNPETWKGLQDPPVLTLYVQPGHYLCLGDNSPQSSDGRSWGLVPERLLLGRALLVYYPFDRAGRIR
jgi:signal peptidase I